ncbi:tRNA threonylcarbamoyladenosine dehydratase [Hathewaya massiliensis]|uniref:tRNA threonylcarbamoyladenosine dehydratase n=1 Tax=Hathewaya massiliensis TaxID=1964382 RepID=UPI0011576127|nr:tRNA threonylcarbamoyladenosine dehydratase [Hathewaya massiliensis]
MLQHSLSRTELLIGKEALEKLKNSKVVVLGIGGVGSFATEALARAGVGKLILVDDDTVCLTNLNRQIIATYDTISKAKVEVMKERILSINPKCNVKPLQCFINKDNIKDIIEEDVDYVIDAIDTVSSKIEVIDYCYKNNIKIISSMGTGNKLDPTKFKITTLNKTKVCPLAKVMRHELRKRGIEKVKVLYSEELPRKPKIEETITCKEGCVCNGGSKKCSQKRQIPASISFVPPVAGMIIGGEVIKEIIEEYI